MIKVVEPFLSSRVTAYIGFGLALIVSLYLIMIPVTQHMGAYETFYIAADSFKQGLDPYANYYHDLYKYSPTFLLMILWPLSFLPKVVGAVSWQILSLVVFFVGMASLLKYMPMARPAKYLFSLMFIFFGLSDLVINGTYVQTNTFLLGLLLVAMSFYLNKQFVLAALVLACATNMKILPLALTLLLFIDLNKRFISWTLVWHVVLALLPFVMLGNNEAVFLYGRWLDNLMLDKQIEMGETVHFYLGLRPFFEANFNWIWGESYFLLVLFNAVFLAYVVTRMKKAIGVVNAFSSTQILMIFATSLLFILLFSTRTEGSTLALMIPVYLIGLWWCYNDAPEKYRRLLLLGLFLLFLLISQSTSDLFRGSLVQVYSWEHNLRALGILVFYAIFVFALFKHPLLLTPYCQNGKDHGAT